MANKTIQFLRNSAAYETKAAAIAALKALSKEDGSIIVGRYTSDASVKSLMAVYSKGTIGTSCTIFDVDDDALAAINNYTVNGKKISENPVLAGTDLKVGGNNATYKNGTVEAALSDLDTRIKAAVSGGVTKITAGDYITVDNALNINEPTVSAKVQAVSTSSASAKGLAEASDVKAYVDGKVNDLDANVTGNGDVVTVQVVEEDGVIKQVNVVDTGLQAAVENANSAVQSVTKGTDAANGYFTTTIAGDDKNPTVAGAVKVSTIAAATKAGDGLVDAFEVKEALASNTTNGKVTLVEGAGDATSLKKYTIKQGGVDVGTINIPKDLVVTSGEVIVATNEAGLTKGDKYIKLTIANQTAPVYINVKDLVDVYTPEANATQVQVAISDTNEISASIVAGSIDTVALKDGAVTTAKIADANVTEAKLSAELANKINNASDKTTVVAKDAATYSDVTASTVDKTTTYTVKNKVQAVSTSSASAKGLAEASDVKAYVDGKVNDLDANVNGNGNFVTVKVVEEDGVITEVIVNDGGLQDAVNNANSAVQTIAANGDNYIVLESTGNENVTLSASLTIKSVADAAQTGQGVADAYDVKTYVDNAVGAVSVAGTANQIKVTNTNKAYTVGFADDAIFDCGEY